MEVFTSKIDAWIYIVIVLAILVSVIGAFFSAKKTGVLPKISALILIIIGAILPTWLLLSTKYVVAQEQLQVFSGPFTWTIPIAEITSVQETRNPKSAPALSLDRLQINYGDGKSIMVSPKEKLRFQQAINH